MDSGLVELVEDSGVGEEVPAWSLPFLMCMEEEPEKSGVILNFKILGSLRCGLRPAVEMTEFG